MAEESGFFDAQWDPELFNEETGELGDYDIRYLMKQFTDYFSLFVGNGVFASPVNQCKVIPGTGNAIIVSVGWAFINGCWYHNKNPKEIPLLPNQTNVNRIDSVRLRFSEADREITASVFTGDTEIVRSEGTYDLKLADIIVPPFAVTVSAANISDARPNESVCGFVKGLVDVINTEDLFSQYNAMFEEWFSTVKDQLQGDLAIKIQLELEQVLDTVEASQNTIQAFTDSYYVISEQTLTFTNKTCVINDEKITERSLVDVYFTADTILEAENSQIYVDSGSGTITLTAESQPVNPIKAVFSVRIL